jgi:hypothetical protein
MFSLSARHIDFFPAVAFSLGFLVSVIMIWSY